MQVGMTFQCITVMGEKAVFIAVCRGGDLLVCQRVDEFSSQEFESSGFMPHGRHCVAFLSKTPLILMWIKTHRYIWVA